MDKAHLTRREVLGTVVRLAVLGAVPVGAIACSGGEKKLECNDTSSLPSSDLNLRNSLAYVDASPHGTAKNCTNCNFFQPAAPDKCGTCTLVKGPIHPGGYCNSWAIKAS